MKTTHLLSTATLFLTLFLVVSSCGNNKQRYSTEAESQPVDTIQAVASHAIKVTADNFNRAETDMYFAVSVKEAGGTGTFFHRSELMSIDNQVVIRANRDVLYSSGVFDLDAGPVTITIPDPGKRFMSMMVVDEDHYASTVYAPGTFTYTREQMGTRYILLGIRTF
ncbi:MAG TPA: DUF1254 domain-containing protein, partial [Saprospiraceae bacterium]|nr:DUF1254 domain-containing protein [Saprospiraceae bacterium]